MFRHTNTIDAEQAVCIVDDEVLEAIGVTIAESINLNSCSNTVSRKAVSYTLQWFCPLSPITGNELLRTDLQRSGYLQMYCAWRLDHDEAAVDGSAHSQRITFFV